MRKLLFTVYHLLFTVVEWSQDFYWGVGEGGTLEYFETRGRVGGNFRILYFETHGRMGGGKL